MCMNLFGFKFVVFVLQSMRRFNNDGLLCWEEGVWARARVRFLGVLKGGRCIR